MTAGTQSKLIELPEPGAQVLRQLEREAADAAHAARVAEDAVLTARGRADAVRQALAAALDVPPGYVLDLEHGVFLAPPGQASARDATM